MAASTNPGKITIREVAAHAGVSTMTVSRVMRNEPQVAKETRQLVQDAIKALNYIPLQSARSLSSGVAKVVGLVVPHSAADVPLKSGYEYMSALHLGAIQACNERGYGLMLLDLEDDFTPEQLIRRVHAKQIGAYVVAAPATEAPALIGTLREQGIVYSAINPLNLSESSLWVAADERAAAYELASHMAGRGHRSIAYVGGGAAIRASCERFAGYQEALASRHIAIRDEWIMLTGVTFEAGLEAGRLLLDDGDVPSAVHCENDDLAAGVIAAAHERGMRLPIDLSVVGFDNFGLAHKVWPALTTAHLPIEAMAALATRQVIATLEGQSLANQLFACPIQLRQSVADFGSDDADRPGSVAAAARSSAATKRQATKRASKR